MNRAVIDIETLKDFFCITALDYDSDNYIQFEISRRKNDFDKIKKFLKSIEYFIGFNSISFDETVLLFIIQNNITNAKDTYLVAQEIIVNQDNNLDQKYKKLRYNKPWKSIDLFLYWSKMLRISKKLSLKYFAVNLDMNVQEMPIHHSKDNLTVDEMDQVLQYNLNDCYITKALAQKPVPDMYGVLTQDKINLRVWVKKEYNLDCLSFDSPKIVSELLLDDYCKKTFNENEGIQYWEYKKLIRSSRYNTVKSYRNGDYLPKIYFKTKVFQDLYKEICDAENGFNKDLIYKQPDNSYIKISYGSGGIHSVNKNESYISDENSIIYTSDVASLYPNLLINYKFIREDLYPVLERYIDIKQERIEAKKAKLKNKDSFLKLILNTLTGLLDNEYSWMYSPEQIMALRLTGQLLLTRLLEECSINLLVVKSLNTDGIEIIIPKGKEDLYFNIIKIIEKEFNVLFEHEKYKFINYTSVNDYICQTFENKIKVKGEYIYEKVLDGSNEFLIIPIAIKEYFVNNKSIEETILNHKNIFDFCMAKKVDKKYILIHNTKKVQQLNRFYCSKKGAYLYKQKEDKNTLEHVFKESSVQIINNPSIEFPNDINYQFYINKTQEKINLFKSKQLKLF